VFLLARSFLYSKRVRDLNSLSASLFGRVFTFYLSSKPPALAGVSPKDRFFDEFDTQAGGKHKTLPLDTVLTIIRPIEADFPFALPRGATAWFQEKLAKYRGEGHEAAITKGTFVQIRNLKCQAYQATRAIARGLELNAAQPPPPVQLPHPRRFPPRHEAPAAVFPPFLPTAPLPIRVAPPPPPEAPRGGGRPGN
jgi:hypothetical protein